MAEKTEKSTAEVQDERVYKLTRPIYFEEKEYTELVLDFEGLTGVDIMRAEQEMMSQPGNAQRFIPILQMDSAFQAAVAAKAAGVYVGVITAMGAKDYLNVTSRARIFLLSTD